MKVALDVSGIEGIATYFERFPDKTATAMSLAINQTMTRSVIPLAVADILQDTRFPEGYLTENDRLAVSQYATPTRLEGRVTARQRPTSLARFATSAPQVGRGKRRGAVTVSVKPGSVRTLRTGFFIQLRSGNLGIAIRLRPGEVLPNKRDMSAAVLLNPKKDGDDPVYLLYGPSVDQVFGQVADDISPEVASALEAEFLRQLTRLVT